MNSSGDGILEYLLGHRSQFIELLERFVTIESPSTEKPPQKKLLTLVGAELTKLNYRVTLLSGRLTGGCLYARPYDRQRSKPSQLLLGHCDTVWPSGTLKKMPIRINDDTFHGPGTFDMKAGLVQMIFALNTLFKIRSHQSLSPIILITSDEEIGSPESFRCIKRIARCAERVYVLEPALGPAGKLKTARKGVWHFDIVINGKSAHAGIAAEEGASAIREISYVVQKLFALNDPQKGISVNVGMVRGGERRNVIAQQSIAHVDVRVISPEDGRRIEETIRKIKPETANVTIAITGGMTRLPMERTPRNQRLWIMAKQLASTLGLKLQEGVSGGASDGNYTSQYSATLDGLGPIGDGAHADHEYININRTIERCALLTLLLLAPSINLDPAVESG